MEIKRFDTRPGCSRLVIHNKVAYFTGHVSPKADDLLGQTKAIFERYDELFKEFNLSKKNILMVNSYLDDISQQSEYETALAEWVGADNPPAGASVEAKPASGFHIEIALIVATE